ncbi:MAG: Na+/H+ antiporter subunit E [Candidatus Bathyarchaeota archaeon]
MVTYRRLASIFPVSIVLLAFWISLSASLRLDEITVGIIVTLSISALASTLMVYGDVRGKFNLAKWFWALVYFGYYWFYAEIKSHADVIWRILNIKMPIKPGIVKVPYTMKTDCGITFVANSITNTPGTITVDVDEINKCYYIHWINVASQEPEVCHSEIISGFEKYLKRFFG